MIVLSQRRSGLHFSVLVAAALFLSALLALACKGPDKPADDTTTTSSKKKPTGPVTTKVTAFAVSSENLNVDKISVRDGITSPDGSRDLAFTATVEGPADALYLVTCTQKGEPLAGFRADTISGHEALPDELGSVVDVGRLTPWIGIVENNKWINDGASLGTLTPGPHPLKLYVPNTGGLREGTFLRLYARAPGGALVAGPIVQY